MNMSQCDVGGGAGGGVSFEISEIDRLMSFCFH